MQKPTFKARLAISLFFLPVLIGYPCIFAQEGQPEFKALVLTERGGLHEPFVVAGLQWLEKLAAENHFALDVLNHADQINEAFLANYRVFIQLNFPPYTWSDRAQAAFRKYIEEGKGGG